MSTKSTLYIHLNILKKIEQAERITGLSYSEIIKRLLMKVLAGDCSNAGKRGPVQYQSRDNEKMWKRQHITYNSSEYEYFQDLRRLAKMSLSYAVAFAIKKYLNDFILGKNCDKYYFQNHKISKESVGGTIYWKICWGLPKNIEKYSQFDST